MIEFLSSWIEQITIAVIIVSILELILPNGNTKKYIKVVLGIYVIFCMISPFVNKKELFDIEQINLNTIEVSSNIENIYIEQMKKDIKERVEELGGIVEKVEIDANLNKSSKNAGINKIIITTKEKNLEKIQEIRKNISNVYEINENQIEIIKRQ